MRTEGAGGHGSKESKVRVYKLKSARFSKKTDREVLSACRAACAAADLTARAAAGRAPPSTLAARGAYLTAPARRAVRGGPATR